MVARMDFSVMRYDNRFADGKPDAHSLVGIAAAVSVCIISVKDIRKQVFPNAQTVIFDVEINVVIVDIHIKIDGFVVPNGKLHFQAD